MIDTSCGRLSLSILIALALGGVTVVAQIPTGSILWLRGDSGAIATGGGVALWRDGSGHGNDARQDVESSRPMLVPNAANGHAVVRFNGASRMTTPAVFPVRSDYSLTFVVRINNVGATNNVLSGTSHAHWFGGDVYPRILHGGNFATQTVSSIPITTSYTVVTMTYREDRRRAAIYVDGFFADSAVTDPNTDSTIYLGAFQGANYLDGDLAEVVLYRRELSADDRGRLEGYLLARYAITLPKPYNPPAAGPLLWLKADSGLVIQNGRVVRWADASGNGYAARQDSASLRPSFLRNAIFNLPAVRFSGEGPFMEGSPVFPTRSDYSLLFVVRINNLAATNNVVSGNSHAHWFGGNSDAKVLHGDFTAQSIASIPIVRGEFTVVTMTYREARKRATIHINSHFADSAVVGTNIDSVIFLGSFARGNLLNGDLAEVILYRRELSDADRMASENYLFNKYAIPIPPPPPPPDLTFGEVPKSGQLYPREENDSAAVGIAGVIRLAGYDSIYATIERNGGPWKRVAAPLRYDGGSAPFDMRPTIHAELSEYRVTVGMKSATRDTVLTVRDSVVCGDVFLIDGQSNSIFGGSPEVHEFCRTFGRNYSSSPRDTLWSLARADGYGGGPHVGAWGLRMQDLLTRKAGVPICIINGGVGGTSVEQHQRIDANPTDLGTIYGSMLYRVRKAGVARKAKALLWYQGEANTIANYYGNFSALREDWLVDYPNLRKFYVVQIRPGCAAGPHSELRDLLRTLPDSFPDVESFSVMGVPGHDGCHYTVAGYDTIGSQLYRLVARDFYGSEDTVDIGAPDIRRAFFTNALRTTIALLFSNARHGLYVTGDTTVGGVSASIRDAFFVDDSLSLVESVTAHEDTVFLRLVSPSTATTVGYIPSQNYPGTGVVYEGPWLKNMRGVGAFSFFHVPINGPDTGLRIDEPSASAIELGAVPNPFSSRTELRVAVAHQQSLHITLYDALGREARHLDVDAHTGLNIVTIDRSDLAAGFYLCRVAGMNGARIFSLMVL